MAYERPQLFIHGSVEALTMSDSQGGGSGTDCKLRGTNGYKQAGGADLNVQSMPNEGLGSCSA
ncbi:MAG TPA: hypothetical protein VFT50_13245 [Baekduia sp.]|nr:hypothetical protein [Baekduia sp.]